MSSSWYVPSLNRAASVDTPTTRPRPAPAALPAPPKLTPDMVLMRLEAVLVHCKEFVATVDADWRFTFVNMQFLRTYGMTHLDQALGKTPFDIYPGFRKSIFFGAMDEVMTRRRSTSRVGFSELTKRWYLCRGVPINGGAALFATDITEDQDNREKLASLSAEDPLTGMPNRVALETKMADLRSASSEFCMAVVGLNRLRSLGDALGRSAEDKIVLETAARLTALAGDAVSCYRLDADEFALVATMSSQEFAGVVANALGAVDKPVSINELQIAVSASAGVVTAPQDGEGFDVLVRRAGVALATARREPGAVCKTFQPSMESAAMDRLRVEQELRRRVQAGALEMQYLVRADARTGRPNSLEARIDWKLPAGVSAPQATLRAFAGEAGLLADIDAWSLDTVTNHAAMLLASGLKAPIQVTLSSAILCSTGVTERVRALLEGKNLPAGALEVEVDGATLQMDIDSGRNVLAQLADMGVKVTAGGLGAGLSTLTNLVQSRVSALKLGEGLVGQVSNDDSSRVVMTALVGLGHGLGMEVVADGVHTAEVLEAVREMKCDSAQGLAVAPPMSIEAISGYLQQGAVSATAQPNPFA